jgi:hypothetical protein
MDLRITTATGTDTVTTIVDGRRIDREDKWSIYVVEGIPGVGPRQPPTEEDDGWSMGEKVAAGVALLALVLYAWYVPSTEMLTYAHLLNVGTENRPPQSNKGEKHPTRQPAPRHDVQRRTIET